MGVGVGRQTPFLLGKSQSYRFLNEYWPRGHKTIFTLNSAEHEIYHAYKC